MSSIYALHIVNFCVGLAKKIEPSIQVQYEGRNVAIKCFGEVREWTLNGETLPADVTIKLKNVQMHHSGKYQCLMAAGEGKFTWETSDLYVGGQ